MNNIIQNMFLVTKNLFCVTFSTKEEPKTSKSESWKQDPNFFKRVVGGGEKIF
jgi:hypothetical protein